MQSFAPMTSSRSIMESSSTTLLLLTISMLSISSATIEPDCGSCSKPHPPTVKPPTTVPLPPVTLPPVTLPSSLDRATGDCSQRATVAACHSPSGAHPTERNNVRATIASGKGHYLPDRHTQTWCLCGSSRWFGSCCGGGSSVHECCPVLSGLVELEAAACLCTTLKIKALNLNIYVPIALQVLATCGKTPPPGYTCSI